MAARAIVAERRGRAVESIRKDAAALSEALGVDASAFMQDVRGDAAYQEMVRTEQLAALLAAVRAKVAPKPVIEKRDDEGSRLLDRMMNSAPEPLNISSPAPPKAPTTRQPRRHQ